MDCVLTPVDTKLLLIHRLSGFLVLLLPDPVHVVCLLSDSCLNLDFTSTLFDTFNKM